MQINKTLLHPLTFILLLNYIFVSFILIPSHHPTKNLNNDTTTYIAIAKHYPCPLTVNVPVDLHAVLVSCCVNMTSEGCDQHATYIRGRRQPKPGPGE